MKRILLLWSAVLVLAFSFMSCTLQPSNSTIIQQGTVTSANISLTGLSATPSIVQLNEDVKITVDVTNRGGTVGTYPLSVEINVVQKINENVIINGRTIKTFNYSVSVNKGGTYNVTVGDMRTKFSVLP